MWREAIGTRSDASELLVGNEMMNGREGAVMSRGIRDSGIGLTTVACPSKERAPPVVEIANDSRVTSPAMSGKGTCFPGCGNPGIAGTIAR